MPVRRVGLALGLAVPKRNHKSIHHPPYPTLASLRKPVAAHRCWPIRQTKNLRRPWISRRLKSAEQSQGDFSQGVRLTRRHVPRPNDPHPPRPMTRRRNRRGKRAGIARGDRPTRREHQRTVWTPIYSRRLGFSRPPEPTS